MRNRQLILAVTSSVLFPLALPNELFPMGSPFVGLIALAPLYLAFVLTRDVRQAVRLGMLFGALSTFLANYWLLFFGEYTIWTITGPVVGYVGYNAVLAGFLWYATHAPRVYRPFLFAAVWTVYEYLKSIGFLAYPWGLSAYPFNGVPVAIQIVDITGVWGLCLVAVLVNCLIGEAMFIRRRGDWHFPRSASGKRQALLSRVGRAIAAVARAPRTAQAMMILLLVGTILGYGAKRVSQEIPSSGTIRVLLVQQNADAWNTQDIARPLLVAQHLTKDGLEASDMPPDFIAWSETSLRYLYDQGRTWYQQNPAEQPFAEFLASLPSPLLTGAPLRNPVTEYAIHNAVLLLLQDGSIDQWYGKRHLVPFVENIPFWDSPLVRSLFQNVVGIPGIWAPGSGDPLLELTLRSGETARIATPICFEDGFPDLVRYLALEGAEILLNLTNNSWSRTDSAQLQHFVAARFRAVETRLGLVRSTNSGYTAVVDPWGSVAASLPMFEAGYLISDVPLYDAPMTMYTRFGDFLPQFLVLVLAVLFAISEIGRLSATKSPRLGLARGRR